MKSINDYYCADQKTKHIKGTPLLSEEICNIALKRKEPIDMEMLHDYSTYLTMNDRLLMNTNVEDVVEVFFAYKYNLIRTCDVGEDYSDGTDSKSVLYRKEFPSAKIANCKTKKSLRIMIIHEDGKILWNFRPIPVDGVADTFNVPITPEGLVWDGWEYSSYFAKKFVGKQKDRGVGGTLEYINQKVLNFTENAKSTGLGNRVRTTISRRCYDRMVNDPYTAIFTRPNGDVVQLNMEPIMCIMNKAFGDGTRQNPLEICIGLDIDGYIGESTTQIKKDIFPLEFHRFIKS